MCTHQAKMSHRAKKNYTPQMKTQHMLGIPERSLEVNIAQDLGLCGLMVKCEIW